MWWLAETIFLRSLFRLLICTCTNYLSMSYAGNVRGCMESCVPSYARGRINHRSINSYYRLCHRTDFRSISSTLRIQPISLGRKEYRAIRYFRSFYRFFSFQADAGKTSLFVSIILCFLVCEALCHISIYNIHTLMI